MAAVGLLRTDYISSVPRVWITDNLPASIAKTYVKCINCKQTPCHSRVTWNFKLASYVTFCKTGRLSMLHSAVIPIAPFVFATLLASMIYGSSVVRGHFKSLHRETSILKEMCTYFFQPARRHIVVNGSLNGLPKLEQCFSVFLVTWTSYKVSLILRIFCPKWSYLADHKGKIHINI